MNKEIIEYLNENIELNKTLDSSFGFISEECIKFKIKNIILCVVFDGFLYIELNKSQIGKIKSKYIVDRTIDNLSWVKIFYDDTLNMIDIINDKINVIHNSKEFNSIKVDRKVYLTGEDIDMFNEKEYEDRLDIIENTCDKSVDGA